MEVDASCPFCNRESETLIHAFFGCCHVAPYWFALSLSFRFDALSVQQPLEFIHVAAQIFEELDAEALRVLLTGCSAIWERRNIFIFQGEVLDIAWLLNRSRMLLETAVVKPRRSTQVTLQGDSRWVPPGAGLLKINIDAAFEPSRGAGFVLVARDGEGSLLAAACGLITPASSPILTETIGLRWALCKALAFGFTNVVFESDWQVLVKAWNGKTKEISYFASVLDDCRSIALSFECFTFSFITRTGNQAADFVAKLAYDFPNVD